MNFYVPLSLIRKELLQHYEKFGSCCTISFICEKLRKKPELLIQQYNNPFSEFVESLTDKEFMDLFFQSLYPVGQTWSAIKNNDPYSYNTETLFSKNNLFLVFLHENFAKQGLHSHQHFEITYVYQGECTIIFENSSLQMKEGNICIVPPGTIHEPLVLDRESFVISLSMTAEAFEAAFSVVLLRRDLIASYIQTILFGKNMQNYLFIPCSNTDSMKIAVRHIAYEARRLSSFSYSFCVSWLSIFMNCVLANYQSNIQLFNEGGQKTSHSEYMALLNYIQSNYRTVTLDSVAKIFNYNKSYLSRLILQITGKSFIENITEFKLNAGKELLENTDYSLDQIAELIGYSSGDYFSKALKKKDHISPSEYRKKAKAQPLV
ncbi:AraC family transcriptional regulator [Ruminococcus sp. CLA-AA-H200]|uniref:AraC family transcriptional regulator n=1 Tax=Ruminococcus turbiniformis TaxID=2881258 RepID=A0ABS8FV82_9FIRM|nr:AraC family transcriptional regulator [Ruminococcus turbiniformis]MCC2253273.1 AraC family transcriptional regulator [Ruminococcus turbiniformis]